MSGTTKSIHTKQIITVRPSLSSSERVVLEVTQETTFGDLKKCFRAQDGKEIKVMMTGEKMEDSQKIFDRRLEDIILVNAASPFSLNPYYIELKSPRSTAFAPSYPADISKSGALCDKASDEEKRKMEESLDL